MQKKKTWKYFVHSRVWRRSHWIRNFVTLKLREIWSKFCVKDPLSIKSTKLCHKNRSELLTSGPLIDIYKIEKCLQKLFSLIKDTQWSNYQVHNMSTNLRDRLHIFAFLTLTQLKWITLFFFFKKRDHP